jgi:hypothetical protein
MDQWRRSSLKVENSEENHGRQLEYRTSMEHFPASFRSWDRDSGVEAHSHKSCTNARAASHSRTIGNGKDGTLGIQESFSLLSYLAKSKAYSLIRILDSCLSPLMILEISTVLAMDTQIREENYQENFYLLQNNCILFQSLLLWAWIRLARAIRIRLGLGIKI